MKQEETRNNKTPENYLGMEYRVTFVNILYMPPKIWIQQYPIFRYSCVLYQKPSSLSKIYCILGNGKVSLFIFSLKFIKYIRKGTQPILDLGFATEEDSHYD